MPRIPRVVVPGIPHLLMQGGNRREDVFFDDGDRQRYLQLLREYSAQHGIKTLAYCLMTNHVHLVCVPARADSLARVLKPVHLRYAQHLNWTRGIGGRLWQGRFFSCPLDEEHLWAAIRYVERNPVRARLVRKAELYPWSSAGAHCGKRTDPLLAPLPKPRPKEAANWAAWLAAKDDEQMLLKLRLSSRTGRPVGSKRFLARLESKLGRRLQARPIGRPRKGKPR